MRELAEVGIEDDLVWMTRKKSNKLCHRLIDQLANCRKNQRRREGCVKIKQNSLKELLMANYVSK